jgi:ribosomal-protein-serine acetyltransferase
MSFPINSLIDLKRLDAGDGIVMRPVRMYHGEDIYAGVAANRESLGEWLPWVPGVKSLADTRDFIRSSMDRQDDGAAIQLAVWVEGEFAGQVGLHGVDWENARTSIGYWLTGAARGRGVMTACVKALTDFALCELKLNRVEIRCAVENRASRAIPERLGYVEEGTAREDMAVGGRFIDLIVYAALAREWRCGGVPVAKT